MPKDRTHRLTIFLLKESLASPDDAVDKTGVKEEAVSCGGVAATLFYRQANAHPPGWSSFFDGDPVHGRLLGLKVASNGALMLVPAGGRHFAMTWGTGRHMLAPGTYEENFGLRVTLNSLTAEQIRSIDHVTFDAHTLHQRAQSSRAGTFYDFRVDIDQNLVKSLTGSPSDKTLAVRMTGVEPLSISVQINRAALPDLLVRYLDQYNSKAYQANFAWIDHLRPVLDQAQVDTFDAELIAKLQAGDLARLWLGIPEILEQEDVEYFTYKQGKRAKQFHDTSLPDFLATIDDPSDINVAMLKKHRLLGYRASTPGSPKSWPVYRCLYCEIDKGTDTYLLYDGHWYRITRDFVQSINEQVKAFVSTSTLPPFDIGRYAREGDYNAAVAATQPNHLLLDARNLHHGGSQSQIEICDLLDLDRRLVHVKHARKSATLSHLFNQGEVSARLLLDDKSFREKVINELSGHHRALIGADGITASQFTVVFAVATDSDKPIESALPFFSRLTFVGVAKRLRSYGYKVELLKIDVIDTAPTVIAPVATSAIARPPSVAAPAPAP